jgi:hypothetical protein
MQTTLTLNTKKAINGDLVKAELQLPAGRCQIIAVHMNYPCRAVLYVVDSGDLIRTRDMNRLPSMPPPEGVQASFMGVFAGVDFDARTVEEYRKHPWVWPHWLPVTVKGFKPVPVLIESRAGTAKHKINLKVDLVIEYGD